MKSPPLHIFYLWIKFPDSNVVKYRKPHSVSPVWYLRMILRRKHFRQALGAVELDILRVYFNTETYRAWLYYIWQVGFSLRRTLPRVKRVLPFSRLLRGNEPHSSISRFCAHWPLIYPLPSSWTLVGWSMNSRLLLQVSPALLLCLGAVLPQLVGCLNWHFV